MLRLVLACFESLVNVNGVHSKDVHVGLHPAVAPGPFLDTPLSPHGVAPKKLFLSLMRLTSYYQCTQYLPVHVQVGGHTHQIDCALLQELQNLVVLVSSFA